MRWSAALCEWVDIGMSGGRIAYLECLHTNRGVISEAPIVYLIGDGQLEGKSLVKTWISILAEIFQLGSPLLKKKNSRIQEKLKEKDVERQRERERGDFDSSINPGKDLMVKPVSVVQEGI